jgi:hypothetical protein
MKQSLQSGVLIGLFAPWEGKSPTDIVKDLISFKPTRHVVNIASGVRFFLCCAVDTLLITHLLDEDGDIDTTPPEEIRPLRINVRGRQVHVSSSAVIAIPVQHNNRQIWTTFCPYSNVFRDEDAYHRWAASVPVATVSSSIRDAFEITAVVADRLKKLARVNGERESPCCS